MNARPTAMRGVVSEMNLNAVHDPLAETSVAFLLAVIDHFRVASLG
jgi:hypothetical protein